MNSYFDRYLKGATAELQHDDQEDIRELLVGRRIIAANEQEATLELDNGTTLKVVPNEGCGGCTSGYYELQTLASFDNAITAVDFEERSVDDSDDFVDTVYTLNVYASGISTEALAVAGTDGNGYYGTGYRIFVKPRQAS